MTSTFSLTAAAQSCPSGSPEGICPCSSSDYDVVAWMTGTEYATNPNFYMKSSNSSPSYNSNIYTTVWPEKDSDGTITPGDIWFSKGLCSGSSCPSGSNGYPWDVDTYDSNYVYFAYTNYQPSGGTYPDYAQYLDGAQPGPYAAYPIAPRCVPQSTPAGTAYSSLSISSSGANWVNLTCPSDSSWVTGTVTNLDGANMQLFPPTVYSGLPSPLNTQNLMLLTYGYSGQTGSNWNSVEKSYYNQTYGWVGWELWNWNVDGDGKYTKTEWDYLWTVEPSGNVPPAQPACPYTS
jgi:hypothetical protein